MRFGIALLALAVTLVPVAVYSVTYGHVMTAVALACTSIALALVALLVRSPPATPRPSPLDVLSFAFAFDTGEELSAGGGALVLVGGWGSDSINAWTTNNQTYRSPEYQTLVYGADGVPIETPITVTALVNRLRHDTRLELRSDGPSNVVLRAMHIEAMLAYRTNTLERRTRNVTATVACDGEQCTVTTDQPLALHTLADALATEVSGDEARVRAGEDPWYRPQS